MDNSIFERLPPQIDFSAHVGRKKVSWSHEVTFLPNSYVRGEIQRKERKKGKTLVSGADFLGLTHLFWNVMVIQGHTVWYRSCTHQFYTIAITVYYVVPVVWDPGPWFILWHTYYSHSAYFENQGLNTKRSIVGAAGFSFSDWLNYWFVVVTRS